MREVTGGELVCPEKATLSGACKIIPQEYQNIKCRSIDLSTPVSDTEQKDNMINQIIYETLNLSSDTVVAHRNDYRWVEAFEPVRLDKSPGMTPRLKEKGTYLITGGLGGMGFALAEHLAKTLRANLILTGRSYFPAKDEWKQWLANHDEEDSTSQKIRKIQELEELGAEFLIFSADIADLEQMQTVIYRAEDKFGKVNGVVHSAGIIDYGGIIQRRLLEKTAEVLASKVTGTLVLNTVFADAELDFFVCCSSIATVFYKSKFGEVGYCAANEFLDAFGYYRFSRNGSFTVTINWCDWSEVGMAVRAIDNYRTKREIKTAVSPSEGVDIFLRIIGSEHPRVAVWPKELRISIEQEKSFLDIAYSLESAKPSHSGPDLQTPYAALRHEKSFSDTSHSLELAKPSHSRPDLQTPYAAPRNEQEQEIAETWQELLGIQRIGIYDNYFDLGGDSLLAVQLFARIQKIFGKDLPLTTLFEAPTIEQLAGVLRQEGWSSPWSSIVPIQHSGSKPPFFCVHGCGGIVFHIQGLARHLFPEQPLYALRAQGFEKGQTPHTRIEDMAAFYIKEIQTVQPDGPYYIGATGYGGAVVLEIAQQLKSRGQNVVFLALINALPLQGTVSNFSLIRSIYRGSFKFFFHRLTDFMRHKPLLPYVKYTFFNRVLVNWKIFDKFVPMNVHREERFRNAFTNALLNYTPQVYPGRITCFIFEKFSGNPQRRVRDWYDIAGGGLDFQFVPGTSEDIWRGREPYVRILAEKLIACLEEAQTNNEGAKDTKN
jgi:NAD(P)-dependent dehydrogenase (short-subunit alcohol dehydrogenase family)/acyl carrier protein